jgi:signal transduction histidine kinase
VTARRRIPLGAVLALLTVLTTVPLATFAGVLVYSTWKRQQDQVDRQNIEVVRAISVAVDEEVEHAISALTVLAALAPADPSGIRGFEALCRESAGLQDWQSVELVTPSGEIVMTTGDTRPQVASPEWVDAAVSTGQPSISDVHEDPVLRKWMVTIGVPVRTKQGTVRAVLGARLAASAFSAILRRQHTPGEGVAALLDRTPVIVARTRNEETYIGHPPSAALLEQARNAPEGAAKSKTLEGTDAYTAWHTSDLTGWTIGVGLPADVVDRPTRLTAAALLAVAVVVTGFGVVIALFVRRRLVDAQRAVAEAARALARGEPIAPRPSSIAEIQDLSTALGDAAKILDTRLRERDEAQEEAERQRTAALEREQAGRRAAEALSRAKDEFVATVSHELRTPLNAIFGWVTLLRSADLGPERQRQGLDVIHRNAAAQLALINDLLDMSRVLRGTIRLEMHPIDLGTVVDAAIDALKPTADARRISLNVDAVCGVALVSGDQSRLQQIIFNIVSNSLKFTPPEGRIDVTLETAGDDAVLRIADTGEGIAPEFLPFVFERFRQEGAHGGRPHEGLGIGLSLVRHLAELHGGSVSAASDGKGRGATFSLRLPLLGARASLATDPVPAEAAAGGRGRQLTGARVLVVDDDLDARELLTTIIRDAGGTTVAAASVAEARDAMTIGVPDIIVSDVAMPDVDGYDFARGVRGSGRIGSVPLVAVTAHTRAEDRERAIAAGFDAHLGKPFEPRALVGLLASLILDARNDLHPEQDA